MISSIKNNRFIRVMKQYWIVIIFTIYVAYTMDRVNKLESIIDDLSGQISVVESEAENAKSDTEMNSSETDDVKTEVENLKSDLDSLKSEVDNLRALVDMRSY